MTQTRRADHVGPHRRTYEKNRKRILASQDVCGICGQPVDKSYTIRHFRPTMEQKTRRDAGYE